MLKEQKVAEQIVELTENQWFNSAVFGRILADQPLYTVDRIMEMVVQIVNAMARKYEIEKTNDQTSHGLILANEMKYAVRTIKEYQDTSNLTLPK